MRRRNWLDSLTWRLQNPHNRQRRSRRSLWVRAAHIESPPTAVEQLEPRYLLAATISGFAFEDANGDRVMNEGEEPIANRTIIANPGPSQIQTQTDADGFYSLQVPVGMIDVGQAFSDSVLQTPRRVNAIDNSTTTVNLPIDVIELGFDQPDVDALSLASDSRQFAFGQFFTTGARSIYRVTLPRNSNAGPMAPQFLVVREEFFVDRAIDVALTAYHNGVRLTPQMGNAGFPRLVEPGDDQIIISAAANAETVIDIVATPLGAIIDPVVNDDPDVPTPPRQIVPVSAGEYLLSMNLVQKSDQPSAIGASDMIVPEVSPENLNESAFLIADIDFFTDVDTFRFTAPDDGIAIIQAVAAPGSELDLALTAFDSDLDVEAASEAFGNSLNPAIFLEVEEGEDFRFQVRGLGATLGEYAVTVTVSEPQSLNFDFSEEADGDDVVPEVVKSGEVKTISGAPFPITIPQVFEYDAISDLRTVEFDRQPTEGSFRIRFDNFDPLPMGTRRTIPIEFDADLSDVQTALNAVLGPGVVTVNSDLSDFQIGRDALELDFSDLDLFDDETPQIELRDNTLVRETVVNGQTIFEPVNLIETVVLPNFFMAGLDPGLDSFLTILDSNLEPFDSEGDDIFDSQTLDAELNTFFGFDESIFVVAGSTEGTAGQFELEVSFDEAAKTSVTLPDLGEAVVPGKLKSIDELDLFSITVAEAGTLSANVEFSATGVDPRLNPELIFFGDNGASFDEDDIELEAEDEAIIRVEANETIVVGVAAFSTDDELEVFDADYSLMLSLNPLIDPSLRPRVLTFDGNNVPLGEDGKPINDSGLGFTQPDEVDLFEFEAPVTGLYTIEVQSSLPIDERPFVRVFDEDANGDFVELASGTPLNPGVARFKAFGEETNVFPDRVLDFDGKSILFEVVNRSNKANAYTLKISPNTDASNPLINDDGSDLRNLPGRPVDFTQDAIGSAEFVSAIEFAGDRDIFFFRAQDDGIIRIIQDPVGDLDPNLTVSSHLGKILSTNDDDGPGLGSFVEFVAEKNNPYLIIADGIGASTGAYRLELSSAAADDFGDSISNARQLELDTAGFLTLSDISTPDAKDTTRRPISGIVNSQTDIDTFVFTAPTSQQLSLEVLTYAGALNPFVFVYEVDSDGALILLDSEGILATPESRRTTAGDTPSANLVLEVSEDFEYIVRVSGFRDNIGHYLLNVSPANDDAPADLDFARRFVVDQSGSPRIIDGEIDRVGDRDVYRFRAPGDGKITVTQTARNNSSLDSFLTIFDEDEIAFATNDNLSANTLNSQLTFKVRDDEEYFVEAAAFRETDGVRRPLPTFVNQNRREEATGPYSLRIQFDASTQMAIGDAVGNNIRDADPFENAGPAEFRIDTPNDRDFFRVQAAETGRMVVNFTPAIGSQVDANLLALRSSTGIVVASDDNNTESRRSRLVFDVEEDEVIFISVVSTGSSGAYNLDINILPPISRPQRSLLADEIGEAVTDLFSELYIKSITESEQMSLDEIGRLLSAEFFQAMGGQRELGNDEFVILYLDPVDFTLVDSNGNSAGFTAGTGQVDEFGNTFYSGNGVAEVLIVPNAQSTKYSLQLVGVGEDFQGGAAFVTAITVRVETVQGSLQKETLELSLDFRPKVPNQIEETRLAQKASFDGRVNMAEDDEVTNTNAKSAQTQDYRRLDSQADSGRLLPFREIRQWRNGIRSTRDLVFASLRESLSFQLPGNLMSEGWLQPDANSADGRLLNVFWSGISDTLLGPTKDVFNVGEFVGDFFSTVLPETDDGESTETATDGETTEQKNPASTEAAPKATENSEATSGEGSE